MVAKALCALCQQAGETEESQKAGETEESQQARETEEKVRGGLRGGVAHQPSPRHDPVSKEAKCAGGRDRGAGVVLPVSGPMQRCPGCEGRAYEISSGLESLECRCRGVIS